MGFEGGVLRAGEGQAALKASRRLVAVVIALVALGLVMVYSSTSAQHPHVDRTLGALERLAPSVAAYDPGAKLMRQARWVLLAALVGAVVAHAPLAWLRRLARPLLAATVVLLLATLVLGPEIKNARRWLDLGVVRFQTSEVFKIAVLLYLAGALAGRERATAFGHQAPLFATLAPVGLGVVLVLIEPDLGTSLFLVAEAVVLMGLAGVRPTRFVPFAVTALPLLLFYAYTRFGHVRKRLALYAATPEDGSQVNEALVAIGSGGAFGQGLGQGTQKLGYIAESQTDFIFAVVGEELGFVGCAGVILGFVAFVWYGRRVAVAARELDPHAFYLAAGATFIVAFQALINIAVVTAVVPTKGISLPFISVGGSNLLMAAVCVGLIVNVARRVAAESPGEPWA